MNDPAVFYTVVSYVLGIGAIIGYGLWTLVRCHRKG